ncbi:MAG: tRNA(Ile)-lysidine synthase, partial [Hyphomicrobiales bacterium]|nr:tRNA(Ile)-lysidine synthase [Hyphomicrobiales bacterium]
MSGGPDSTALLWLAARWRAWRKHAPTLIAVTVDHGLRPESAREARAVKRFAHKLDVAHRTLRWSGKKPASGIQQAAREARYRLLAGAARKAGARHILTAHTLDDQAETVLFRLARGSGIAGLRGMRAVTPLAPLPSPKRGGSIAEGDR